MVMPSIAISLTGCWNDRRSIYRLMVDQTLTIVYRGGEFLVAGYARDWDWNSHLADGSVETIMGGCDIDFLGGKGVVSDGLDEDTPIDGNFTPVKLTDWSDDLRPTACDF